MERLKNYYHSNGLYYLARKTKQKFHPTKKLQALEIYRTYISNNLLFCKNSSKIPINEILLENYWTELSNRKLYLYNPYNFPGRFKLRFSIKAQEFDVISYLIKEKDMEIFSKNLIHFVKYHHYIERRMINKTSNHKLNKFVIANSENINIPCLIIFFYSPLFNRNLYSDMLIDIILSKIERIEMKNYNKNQGIINQIFSSYLNHNRKDNILLFSIINIINYGYNNSIFWDLFAHIIHNRIDNLELPEMVSCSIFILENKYQNPNLLSFISNKIAHICNRKTISLDNNGYQILFNNLNTLKILLDLNKLSFDPITEISLDELFFKFIEDEVKYLEEEINQIKSKPNSTNNNNIKHNESLFITELNKLKIKLIENNFFSNLSFVIAKKNHKAEDIQEIVKLMNNEIHDFNFFKRFFSKRNPFNAIVLLKILAKENFLLKELTPETIRKIADLAIDSICFIEKNFSKKISFLINSSVIKDSLLIMKNLEEKKFMENLLKICFRVSLKSYFDIKDQIDLFIKRIEKENDKDYCIELEMELNELKIVFLISSFQIFEFFCYEKSNQKYFRFNELVKSDIKIFREKELISKKELKFFLQSIKGYSGNIEGFKEICLI